jgi:uncharacterized protein YbcC (UPF0753/DUF2309 family)/NADH:ubiquinone oxidoreductase subunit 5 (subunit L)/multisubunit Na+/H+ antiporter MnhA subunit
MSSLRAAAVGLVVASFGALALLVLVLAGQRPALTVASPDLGPFGITTLGVALDVVPAVLLALVTGLGAVVAVYAARNLEGQHRLSRFAALEATVVLGLGLAVTAASLPLLLLGWTASGLAMAALVSHSGSERARAASRFVRSRLVIGDALLAVAVVVTGLGVGTWNVADLPGAVADASIAAVGLAAVLVVAAGVVRSSLVPAHRWLPEVAEAPSPVSALLHAGFVNGIGILALVLWPLIAASPVARGLALVVGVATALLASAQQRVRPDVKGRLASSTSAQMGYLAITVGVGLPAAVLVHLVGHGLWKAGLFLGAGGAVERVRGAAAASPPAKRPLRQRLAAPLGPRGRGGLAASAAALLGLVVTISAAAVPGVWGSSLLSAPATLLPVAAAAAATATAAYAVAASARGRRSVGVLLVLVAVSAYLLLLRAVDHALAPELGWTTPAWGEPGALALAVIVALLVATGLAAWGVDSAVRRGRFAGLASYVGRTTFAPAPLLRRPRVAGAKAVTPVVGASVAVEASRIAADVVAPVWPLHAFVASNPVAGLERLPFDDAMQAASRAWGSRPGVDASMLRAAVAQGVVDDDALLRIAGEVAPGPDLALAAPVRERRALVRALLLAEDPTEADVAPVRAALGGGGVARARVGVLTTPAERAVSAHPALAPLAARARDLVSSYVARGYGAPGWPVATAGVWAAVREDAPALDSLLGTRGAGASVRTLPADADQALAALVARLGLEGPDLVPTFARVLACDPGWVAHLAWRRRVAVAGERDEVLDLLVARLALEAVVVAAAGSAPGSAPTEVVDLAPSVAVLLAASGADLATVSVVALDDLAGLAAAVHEQGADLLRLRAWEESYRRPVLDQIAERAQVLRLDAEDAPAQVVTCIDVRSERLRRRLEETGPWETLGAAGFFGIALAHVSPNGAFTERLPALLRPRHVVTESCPGVPASRQLMTDASTAVHGAEGAVGAPFALAEAAGWVTGFSAVLHTASPRMWERLRRRIGARFTAPVRGTLVLERGAEAPQGFELDELVAAAAGFLRTTGLLAPAPVVVLLGHGGHAANNPHVAAYDCGACGGYAGDVSARAMAQVLNDDRVRDALREQGIDIADGTVFLAGLHDTTRDRVELLDDVPAAVRPVVERLERDLALACDAVVVERAAYIPGGLPSGVAAARRALDARAVDWAQVRPEWGLARNAAIVIGPRALTRGLDLEGRVFLHSYRSDLDADGSALEFLLTAPLVVAQWISSQYWCSTVDPERFGAGDKTTHNVLASYSGGPAPLTGVVTGARGDLRIGLPWQGVSAQAPVDGRWASLPFHEPVRLLAVVHADPAVVEDVLRRREDVARLVLGEWVELVAVDPLSGMLLRRDARDGWMPVSDLASSSTAVEGEGVATSV